MTIAYLCNVYPKITHTFIRREISALEAEGIMINRITIRRSTDAMPTPEDVEEQSKTFGILERGAAAILVNMFLVFLTRPVRFLKTCWKVVSFGACSKAGLAKHIAYFAESCLLVRYSRNEGISHIHAHFATNPATVAMFSRFLGGPTFSFTIHGASEWDCPEFIHMPEKIAAATFVTTISDFTRSQAFRWTGPENYNKIHVVRCGVDEGFLSIPVTDVPNVNNLVMVGRLEATKGHIVLLEALEKLAKGGVDFRMKLVGDGPLRDFVESQIAMRGLEEHVTLAGWMDNNKVRQEMLSCRAMVLSSFGEGLPVVIMEALALARPVICTRIAAIGELVSNGENGWLVNSGSADDLASAIREALDSPVDELSRMGAAGRRMVLGKHDANVEGKVLASLFDRYLDQATSVS
jgi:glycosyltransferase involved in cell wall biosynthesis